MDPSGKKINFKDFKGNYLLLDFWASYCKPCIANFPYEKKLETKYKGKPIKFIYVSLDRDKEDWKNAINKYNLSGIHLSDFNGMDGMLPVYCKVYTGIPRYVLISKEGKIINYNTPQPISQNLETLLDGLLN
jgi:thiol-disulfide isomerase/thioredoxin